MQHDTSDILFSLIKMTFNLNGSVNQEFNFIEKIKKNNFSVINSNKIHIFCFSSITRLKQDATQKSDISFSAFKNTFDMKDFICFTDIFIYKQFSCHDFIKKSSSVANIAKINHF
jgi:hypothetical protein